VKLNRSTQPNTSSTKRGPGRPKGVKNKFNPRNPRPTHGPPVKFDPPIFDRICEYIALGYSLNAVTKMEGMPSYPTVMKWIWRESSYREECFNKYVKAREQQADFLADELLEIADDGRNDTYQKTLKDGSTVEVYNAENVARSKLRVETRKWIASKLKPKKYGERLQAEVSAPDGAPLIPVATTIILDFGESK